MFVLLRTHDVWVVDTEVPPREFFGALGRVVKPGDILAFGAYEPSARSQAAFQALAATECDISSIYHGSFQFNRQEHPDGRSFELVVSDAVLSHLATMCDWIDGQEDKPLFFDHAVAYRRGLPVLPLFCFHDAFTGGSLYLSGLFEEEAIKAFTGELGVTYARELNPEFKIQNA